MKISKLKRDQQNKIDEILKYYRHSAICRKCREPYGFDSNYDNCICHVCMEKNRKNLKAKRK